ncbi:uncharacterized protein [Venturia canescens]|uniref:uncharacterized protein n=1 Tax=Venturia canescens TaxID=32260 RepID=UPI001C9C65F1|nr:uncharacterized protein LOC122418434 [Venturia canescens]
MYPPSPRTLQSMAEQCQQPECRRLLEYDLGTINTTTITDDEGNVHFLMHDPQFTSEFVDVTHTFIDGTFQTTPRVRGVYQLVTILGVKYDHAIPIAHILMARKTENSLIA